MRRELRALVFGLLLAGCRTPLLDLSQDASVGGDMASTCAMQHQRLPVPLTSLTLADAQPFAGATVRMLAQFDWRPSCDVLGDVSVEPHEDSGPDFEVTAYVWQSSDPTCVGSATASVIVILNPAFVPMTQAHLSVGDGSGGAVGLSLDIDAPAGGSDCVAVGLSGNCQRDCQCDAAVMGALCIPVGEHIGVCQISCDEDADCVDVLAGCAKTQSIPPYICAVGQCVSDADCPFGQHCESAGGQPACRPPTQLSNLPASCSCDSDCGFGAVCASLACVEPCATSNDCPGHGACANTCIDGQCKAEPCQ
jgi:hypothetical protein